MQCILCSYPYGKRNPSKLGSRNCGSHSGRDDNATRDHRCLSLRDVNESQIKVLALRKKAVVQMYSKWAATFIFQKLVVAIKLSLKVSVPSWDCEL